MEPADRLSKSMNDAQEDTGYPPGMTDASESDQEARLLARIRSDDPGAWKEFVVRFEPVVAATVIGMLGPGPDAQDVGQEVFIRFHRALASFRHDAGISTFLTRTAMNLSLNAIKRRSRMRRWFSGPPDETLVAGSVSPGEQLERTQQVEAVQASIRRLPADYRAVVVLRFLRGMSTRETAELLGIPQGTAMSRLARAQKRLREDLTSVLDHAT
jgi:RNA polymerase sigma-70 factor (ECF subfamily)